MPISYRTIADKKVPRQQRFDLDALHLFHNTLVNSVITFGRIFSRVIRVEEKLRFAFFSLSLSDYFPDPRRRNAEDNLCNSFG